MDSTKSVIMLVDDNLTNLTMGKNILKDQYNIYPLNSASMLFELIDNVVPDLILLDIEMPEMDGFETIKKLKANPATADIPVFFLTSKSDPKSELEGFNLGAADYISKPFSPPLLLKRIENQLIIVSQTKKLKDYNDNLQSKVDEKTKQVLELQNAILRTVAELVEFRDDANSGHIERTQKYLQILIRKMVEKKVYSEEISQWDLNFLIPAAQLHDVGKIAISDILLNKPNKFSKEEFELMKKHTIFGVAAIKEIEKQTKENAFLYHAKIFAGTHHEKWDGTGYPRGLKGTAIPLQGRIMAIADVYDALISSRPYKAPISIGVAERIIVGSAGTHFDPVLVDVFKQVANQFSEIARITK
ncbi:MAG: two-component system response regulator [Termitinemataceae bacterium]|nr:MAG: two-component system response regulator [Termitinemataceae bacterium]